jgi:GntR family transcriptional regulator
LTTVSSPSERHTPKVSVVPEDDRIDPLSPTLRHIQVANKWRCRILAGEVQPGVQLPSRADLAKRHGVAEMTVHKGLALLVNEGLIHLVPGVGMFVSEREKGRGHPG